MSDQILPSYMIFSMKKRKVTFSELFAKICEELPQYDITKSDVAKAFGQNGINEKDSQIRMTVEKIMKMRRPTTYGYMYKQGKE